MSFAKVTLLGNLGKDPETFTYGQGDNKKKAAKFSLAVNTGRGDDQKTEWFNCAVYGAQAKVVMEYMKKGSTVVVFGKLSSRKYSGDKGEGFSLDVNVEDVQFAGSKKDGDGGGSSSSGSSSGSGSRGRSSGGSGGGGGRPAPAQDIDDGDVPF